LFSIPARIVEIDDKQALEWQLVENSQRVDVHPYEEAQGFQRLLDVPGCDVAALVEKSGKSASHVYARLSLLQLIPTVAVMLGPLILDPFIPENIRHAVLELIRGRLTIMGEIYQHSKSTATALQRASKSR
jgi:hypothetical protein